MSDARRRWVTLAACVVASACAGFGYAWSVYLKPMAAANGWSGADVSLSYAALMSTAAAMPLVSGWALKYVPPRRLLLIGGALFGLGIVALGSAESLALMYGFAVVAGIGLGTVYPGATMANLIRYFPDRGGFASGFLTAGAGIGGMVLAPVAVWLIDEYGLPWALRLMGLSFFVVIAVCSRLVGTAPDGYAPAGWSAPAARLAAAEDARQKDWQGMLRSPVFYLLAPLFVMGTLSGTLVIGQGAPIVEDTVGASSAAAAAAVTWLALGMVIGKVAWGWVSDRIGRPAVLVLLFVVALAALLLMIAAGSYAPLVLGMAAIASCYGGFVAVMGPVTADAFGTRHLGVDYGVMFLSIAVAAVAGPQLGALAAEAGGGDYTVAFVVAAVISACGLATAAGYFVVLRRARTREAGQVRAPAAD